jgi:serine/threonine-protein kinase HipA
MAHYGEDTVGAVQIVAPDRVGELEGRKGISPISEKRLAQFLSNLVKNPGQTQIQKDGGKFSLPGAQPKKAICYVDDRWYEPRGRTPSTHIIKPPSAYLDGQVENEFFCARLAKAAGLRVADTQIVSIGEVPSILVERYDRQRIIKGKRVPLTSPGGSVYRVHQEDLCQSLSFHPDQKNQRDGGPSMRQIMDFLSGAGDSTLDRERFMRACIFNYVILGIDAHAKNYSVLIEHGGRFRLAPLYDLISALPYDHEEFGLLAMKVGGEGKWRNIGRYHWEKEAKTCGYPAEAAIEYLIYLLETLPRAARSVVADAMVAGLNVDRVLVRLVEELEKRCAKLLRSYKTAVA